MPNIFTPNNDGINELFVPIKTEIIAKGNLTIYNRWGNKIFETNDLDKGWNGNSYPSGPYFWKLNYTGLDRKTGIYKGEIRLLR